MGINLKAYTIIVIFALLVFSCRKDNEVTDPAKAEEVPQGMIYIDVTNMVDTNLLVLDSMNYILGNGDKLKVSRYKYYVSNIRFQTADGNWVSENYSYHLVNQELASSLTIAIDSIPYGEYTAIEFMIGVDSLHNVSGSQTGDLDVALNMFWTWNSGYIMAKLEGTSQQSTAINHAVEFHIGGYKGQYSALKTVSPSFNNVHAFVSSTLSPRIQLKSDVAEWFKSPNQLNLAITNNITTVGAASKSISDNYADMFSVTGIEY